MMAPAPHPTLIPAALPSATPDEIVGLLRIVARVSRGGRIGIAELADAVWYDDERLLSLLELLRILGFAELAQGALKLSLVGRRHVRAGERERKAIFANQLVRRLPLAARLVQELGSDPRWHPTTSEILEALRGADSADDLAPALRQVIAWGRYAGLFAFDETTGRLSAGRGGPDGSR